MGTVGGIHDTGATSISFSELEERLMAIIDPEFVEWFYRVYKTPYNFSNIEHEEILNGWNSVKRDIKLIVEGL